MDSSSIAKPGGASSFYERPPGVEAFLPISSLISLKHLLMTGEINPIHPAGLLIFMAILAISLLLKKAFCSWICPVGFLSEFLWKMGERVYGKNVRMPLGLDAFLRSIKYLLLIFFAWAILIMMDSYSIRSFIYSPYNKVTDVKMLNFFTDISYLTISVLLLLFFISTIFKNFWCRYLCPYGALLGFVSFLSPFKITRNPVSCINCKKCTTVCPESIKVHNGRRIFSDECMACMACVGQCPIEDALTFQTRWSKARLSIVGVSVSVLLLYFSFVGVGRWTGYWNNDVPLHEYVKRIQDIENPLYDHNRGNITIAE